MPILNIQINIKNIFLIGTDPKCACGTGLCNLGMNYPKNCYKNN